MKKKFITTLLLLILILCSTTYSYAELIEGKDVNSDIWGTAKNWIALGKSKKAGVSYGNWNSFNDLAGILWGAGIFIIAIVGGVLGIKYMFSSVEEKASMKESMWPFIIGSVIILGALTIWKFAVELFAGM